MKALELQAAADRVSSAEELAAFAGELSWLVEHGRVSVENDRLSNYIEAFSAWLEGSEGYWSFRGMDEASISPWAKMANALVAGLIYE